MYDADGQGTEFTYNDDDTPATKRGTGGTAETYLYDQFGRMTGYNGAGGTATFRIDSKGRVDQMTLLEPYYRRILHKYLAQKSNCR